MQTDEGLLPLGLRFLLHHLLLLGRNEELGLLAFPEEKEGAVGRLLWRG